MVAFVVGGVVITVVFIEVAVGVGEVAFEAGGTEVFCSEVHPAVSRSTRRMRIKIRMGFMKGNCHTLY